MKVSLSKSEVFCGVLPRRHGWGYRGSGPSGQGAITSGIVQVAVPTPPETEKVAEDRARRAAQHIVDDFLLKTYPSLRLMGDADD